MVATTNVHLPLELTHGSNRCLCTGCGESFNSVSSFDKHQRIGPNGEAICVEPCVLGMVLNEGGWWVSERWEHTAESSPWMT